MYEFIQSLYRPGRGLSNCPVIHQCSVGSSIEETFIKCKIAEGIGARSFQLIIPAAVTPLWDAPLV